MITMMVFAAMLFAMPQLTAFLLSTAYVLSGPALDAARRTAERQSIGAAPGRSCPGQPDQQTIYSATGPRAICLAQAPAASARIHAFKVSRTPAHTPVPSAIERSVLSVKKNFETVSIRLLRFPSTEEWRLQEVISENRKDTAAFK